MGERRRRGGARSGRRPKAYEASDALAAQVQALERRRARDARALVDLGGSAGLPLAVALKRQLAVVHSIFRPRTCFILLYVPLTDRLAVASVRGRADSAVDAARPGEGPLGEAFFRRATTLGWVPVVDRRRGGRVRIDDPLLLQAVARLREDPLRSRSRPPASARQGERTQGASKDPSLRRLVAVPMLSGDRCLGVLGLLQPNFEAGHTPREAERDLLLALGAQAAAAVEIANLRDQAVRRSRDLETALEGTRSIARGRDEALGTLAHELRTPLSTVKGYLTLLTGTTLGELAPPQREAVQVCLRNAERLQRLIHDLILASRLQAGRMELDARPIGLRALAQEALLTLAPVAAELGVKTHLLAGSEAFVRGNRDRLMDVALNMLDNAVRHNRPGGEAFVGIASHGAVARLEVRDTGVGIAEEALEHIFDRFIELDLSPTGTRVGVGLGLAIVRRVVDRHGGKVHLSSEVGKGTVCTVDLPLFAGMAAASDQGEGASTTPGEGRILLVEDDADCRSALAMLLRQEGYLVEEVSGGHEALAALERARPALLLLDLHLPDLDGRLLLREVRRTEALRGLPIFVLSGAIAAAAGLESLAPGERVEGIFEKPLNFPRLLLGIAGRVRPPV